MIKIVKRETFRNDFVLSMKSYFPFLITAGVALAGFCAGMMLYRARVVSLSSGPKKEIAPESNGIRAEHVRGEANARVTLEEFGDFECPPCGELVGIIKQLEADRGSTFRVVFRHHPLSIHPHAQAAALAAEAAELQGRFWEMHDLLYQEQAVWSRAPDSQSVFNEYAKRLGLDVERFKKDCESNEARARIAADEARGTERGVTLTPTLFINDWVVPRSSYSVDGLRTRIAMMAASTLPTAHP